MSDESFNSHRIGFLTLRLREFPSEAFEKPSNASQPAQPLLDQCSDLAIAQFAGRGRDIVGLCKKICLVSKA